MTVYRHLILLLTVIFFSGCSDANYTSGSSAGSSDDPNSAWIKKVSGRYEIDPADSEKPIISVNLGRTEVDDGALAGLKQLPKFADSNYNTQRLVIAALIISLH